ncbi:hypothetical protein OCA08_03210 [Bacillus cereus]|nr:hypothetical protein [Bacillus cereus]
MKKTLFSVLAIFVLSLSTMIPVNAESDNNNVSNQFSGGGFFENETNIPPLNSLGTDVSTLESAPTCAQTFYHAVSTVPMQVATTWGDYRSLMWGFNLTSTSKTTLGPMVTVTMPTASVNGRPINPPYTAHSEPVTYNFHGSLKNYDYMGGNYTLKKGDIVIFTWLITKNSDPTKGAYRYIRCQMN